MRESETDDCDMVEPLVSCADDDRASSKPTCTSEEFCGAIEHRDHAGHWLIALKPHGRKHTREGRLVINCSCSVWRSECGWHQRCRRRE